MEEFFHKHLIKFTIIVTLPLWVAWAFADEIVGYTEHGISVTKNDIEIKSVRVDTIRSWKWIEETDTLRLTLNRKKQVDVEFFNRCFDMPYATGLQFKPWGGFNSIGKGDSITPISWSNRITQWPCTIKRITEVIEDDDVR